MEVVVFYEEKAKNDAVMLTFDGEKHDHFCEWKTDSSDEIYQYFACAMHQK